MRAMAGAVRRRLENLTLDNLLVRVVYVILVPLDLLDSFFNNLPVAVALMVMVTVVLVLMFVLVVRAIEENTCVAESLFGHSGRAVEEL